MSSVTCGWSARPVFLCHYKLELRPKSGVWLWQIKGRTLQLESQVSSRHTWLASAWSPAAQYFSYILHHKLETRGQHSNTNMGGDGEGLEEKWPFLLVLLSHLFPNIISKIGSWCWCWKIKNVCQNIPPCWGLSWWQARCPEGRPGPGLVSSGRASEAGAIHKMFDSFCICFQNISLKDLTWLHRARLHFWTTQPSLENILMIN